MDEKDIANTPTMIGDGTVNVMEYPYIRAIALEK